MDSIDIPNSLLPKGIKAPRAFIADKKPELPDYGVDTGDLVIVDSDVDFVVGELSAFKRKNGSEYRLSKERLNEYRHFGKVITVLKYYGKSPFYKIN